jgi:TorA maturation chaperone TorD
MSHICPELVVDPIDGARGREYALLASLLSRSPDTELIRRLAALECDESPLGVAHASLANAAGEVSEAGIAREYLALFIGLGEGLLPYSSYYLTGSLYGPPLARVRASFRNLGIELSLPWEPEDHIAVLFEVMSRLIGREFPGTLGTDREFFDRHLATWARRFFVDLERAKSAPFYACVGSLGRVFMEIEDEAYALSN